MTSSSSSSYNDSFSFKDVILFASTNTASECQPSSSPSKTSGKRSRKKENNDNDLITSQTPALISLLQEIVKKIIELNKKASSVTLKKDTRDGVSLLQLKSHLMLNYLIHLSFYSLLKLKGISVKHHPVVDELARIRITLEKIRPIENKLSYMIDRLVRIAKGIDETENQQEAIGTRYKPNPKAMASMLDDIKTPNQGNDFQNNTNANPEDNVYRPPRIGATMYDEAAALHDAEERENAKADRELQRIQKRAKSSALVRDLLAEVTDRPEEVLDHELYGSSGRKTGLGKGQNRVTQQLEEEELSKRKYEEDNFIRMAATRKDKIREKKLKAASFANDDFQSGLDEITAMAEQVEKIANRSSRNEVKLRRARLDQAFDDLGDSKKRRGSKLQDMLDQEQYNDYSEEASRKKFKSSKNATVRSGKKKTKRR